MDLSLPQRTKSLFLIGKDATTLLQVGYSTPCPLRSILAFSMLILQHGYGQILRIDLLNQMLQKFISRNNQSAHSNKKECLSPSTSLNSRPYGTSLLQLS